MNKKQLKQLKVAIDAYFNSNPRFDEYPNVSYFTPATGVEINMNHISLLKEDIKAIIAIADDFDVEMEYYGQPNVTGNMIIELYPKKKKD